MVEANDPQDDTEMDPQSYTPKIEVKIPRGKSKFEQIPTGPLQEIMQFLPVRDFSRLICASKRLKWVGDQDFMYRYLTLNNLEFYYKNWTENWKKSFQRNMLTRRHFTKDKFNYMMCPIRQFKTPVVALDSYFNFVVACDQPGTLKIMLIDEDDVENDNDTLVVS